MTDLIRRLHLVRAHFGNPSARRLSQELGVATNSWGVWESGKALPSATALVALAQRDIDIHWLLVGQGKMVRSPSPQPLQRLEQIAGHSREKWGKRMKVLETLARAHPNSVTLERLTADLGLNEDDVAVSLLTLVSLGKVVVIRGSVVSYAAASPVPVVIEDRDNAEMLADVLEFIGQDVFPATEVRPSRGKLFDGRASVQDGKRFVDDVLTTVRERAVDQHDESGSTVRLIVAALIT